MKKLVASFPGFRLKLTRWGTVFLISIGVLILAAANTGNNSLVMLLGLGLGCYAVSGAWSRQVLGKVIVRARPPREAFAGQPVSIEVELENSCRMLPAYGLVLRDSDGKLLHVEQALPAGTSRRCRVELVFEDRGWHKIGPWRLEVLLPLGFFLKSKEVVGYETALVYPRLVASPAAVSGGESEQAAETFKNRGREGEVTSLRAYHEGDELRQIHWKQTARQAQLVVTDRQHQTRRSGYVVVDPRVDAPDDPQVHAWFEQVVSRAASTVVRRIRRSESVGLILGGKVIPPVDLLSQVGLLLRPLALVQLEPLSGEVAGEAQ
jgi:uncharacterized protein (DUF58 family)